MRSSLCLLTAGLLTAGMLSPRCAHAQAAPPAAAPLTPTAVEAAPPPRPFRLGERLRNFFSPRQTDNAVQQTTALQPTTPLKTTPVTTPKGPSDLSLKELEKVGHEQDYSWITGKLTRGASGRWVLRYAGPYEVDRHGGSVLLAPHADLANYHAGDLICVHGRVAGNGSGAPSAGAIYQINSISLIEGASR